MKFPLILAAFIALCGAVEMQNSAAQSSGSAQNSGAPNSTDSGSAQNSQSVREIAWLKDINLTCAKYGIDTSAHPEFRAYARRKDGSALAFASAKAMFAYFFERESSGANFGSAELYVTDYASGEILRAQDAFYVFGSVLQSARGDDLITFARLRDAQDFMREKKGHKILQFREISAKLIDYLR